MTLSHRAAIEIRMWLEDQAQAHQHFNHVRSVVINAEVMAAPLIRICIPSPGPLTVIKALEVIIPKVSTWFGIVSDVLITWQSTIHGIECLVFRLKKSMLLIRTKPGCGNEVSQISQKLAEDIDNLEYITVLRASDGAALRFSNAFW
ncbi:uncharacterized protein RAG0_11737 [Rhynchosporium agropyri]|uniref:Uncharacterized protein n=1 Tax=Rhynchosporium agropyri TaxID=914238 RepID=A0A1E1L5K2_9HELO|nr:uncharacterized protein RAG0_11737 [Rhynchosporium agropyri]